MLLCLFTASFSAGSFLSLVLWLLGELNPVVSTAGAVWQLQGGRFKFPAPWLLFAHGFHTERAHQCCPPSSMDLAEVESGLLIETYNRALGRVVRYLKQYYELKFKGQEEMGPR